MTLACNESCFNDRILHAPEDLAILNDCRVFSNLCSLQKKYHGCTEYLENNESEVQPYMRKILTTWMLQVCDEVGCDENVFPLSINYLDRFLSISMIDKSQLQLLGAVCMLISSKVTETLPLLSIERLIMYTDYSVTARELIDYETLVLLRLKWDILAVTASDFVDHILHRFHLSCDNFLKIRKHVYSFIHLSCTDHQFSEYPASHIATCSVGAAFVALTPFEKEINLTRQCLIGKLHTITGIPVHCLVPGLIQVESILKSNLVHITNCSVPSHNVNADEKENNSLNMSCSSSADVSMSEDLDYENSSFDECSTAIDVFIGVKT